LVRGREACALFEVGISAMVELVIRQLEGLKVRPEAVTHLILSHAHSDHATGQAGLLKRLPRARLVLSAASRRHLGKKTTLSEFTSEDRFCSREVVKKEGIAGWAGEGFEALLPPKGRRQEIEDSTLLDEVGLELIPDEGHAPGALVGWVAEDGALLASDSAGFVSGRKPHLPLHFASYPLYMENLRKFRSWHPDAVCPGHQHSFKGLAASSSYLAALTEHLEREHAAILREHRRGIDEEEIAFGLFRRYYGNELSVYSPESILECCQIVVRRSLEAA
jgi:glyoxylase-like metal-dependent hydrolase (beta-lactamase superfamily II)